MDISSEMIHSLLPVYLVVSLGASGTAVGVIEGMAEATALIVKVFSGVFSDYVGQRKLPAFAGYALGALSKPLFAMSTTVGGVLTARLIDRVGKGIRGAPRDALVADVTPPEIRGAAFGLRQSLDTVGAFTGPLVAAGLMLAWSNNFRAIFWVAVIPAVLSATLLLVGIREPDRPHGEHRKNPINRANLKQLSWPYWRVVVLGALFSLARFSEAFLVLRAQQMGLLLSLAPLVLVFMNLVYALSAYPFGKLADRMSHDALLGWGLVTLVAADITLAQNAGLLVTFAGLCLWGIHMGMTQGLLAAMVAHVSPQSLRGTAYGVFNLLSGIAMLGASVIAGLLWDYAGASTTFYVGAGISAAALLFLLPRVIKHTAALIR